MDQVFKFSKNSSSKLHLDVARHLTGIMPGVRNEESINGLMVDIAIAEMNLVIEVEGPLHNAINSRVPLGATVFKHRLLKAMGKILLQFLIGNGIERAILKKKPIISKQKCNHFCEM